jgi:hypothetical protein
MTTSCFLCQQAAAEREDIATELIHISHMSVKYDT